MDRSPIADEIWDSKYRFKDNNGKPIDQTLDDTWVRVANALAEAEKPADQERYCEEFLDVMRKGYFLPAGRILSGAGTDRKVTLMNCYVMGDVPDDMAGIFESLKEAALTMQQGGGIGYDFSSLRPKGALVKGVGADASGPLSFMDVWDSMCRTIMSAGSRRGAMMAVMRCDHPDIEAFIDAKRTPGRLTMFNLSVLVTDAFMKAASRNERWELTFEGKFYKAVAARELWDKIMRSTYEYAEPGVIFIDRVNAKNNLNYCETIHGCNPCGEQMLPPYGSCDLGSINLAAFIQNPFTSNAWILLHKLRTATATAVRMLDNVINVTNYPLEKQRTEMMSKRRIGLGVTGLADALIMCGLVYGSPEAIKQTEAWMDTIRSAAYNASTDLAIEKGIFPLFDADKFIANLDLDPISIERIRKHGIRNGLLMSIAPTGTISLLADNVSGGLEPVFDYTYERKVLQPDGSKKSFIVADYAYRLFHEMFPGRDLTPAFVSAQTIAPEAHVRMQAAVQKYVDNSISKTINVPKDITFEAFKDVYTMAYDLGCKGCTTYRPNDITGSVISVIEPTRPPQEIKINVTVANFDELKKDDPRLPAPLPRPDMLPGATYKLKWADSPHAIYITINDTMENGRRRPFEIFCNSKNMEHYAWVTALMRMISAVFRRGGDIAFVVDELKAVFDPRGGQFMDQKYVPSVIAAIGAIVGRHMEEIGFVEKKDSLDSTMQKETVQMLRPLPVGMSQCPRCNEVSVVRQEGCDSCTSCGYSKCG